MRYCVCAICATLILSCASRSFGDATSVSAINAVGLKRPDGVVLTGAGVNVGHVDVARAPIPGFDSAALSHPGIIPVESRLAGGQMPLMDHGLLVNDAEHGLITAGIIIGGAGAPTSVAPGANLYSAGFLDPFMLDRELMTTQYIAKRYAFSAAGEPRPHIRAINHSWGLNTVLGDGPYSGDSRITLGMDWIAQRFDVLNVFAGAYDSLGDLPTDNFNGVTVAYTAKSDGFRRVAEPNDNEDINDAAGDRVSVDLLAPGEGVEEPTRGGGSATPLRGGTSIAAPHVTGAVALLNEYSDYQVHVAQAPRWDVDYTRKHEVMKAVLLNSADKDVENDAGVDWEHSIAFTDDQVPLDQQMGAGLLDVGRALRQFASGEYNNGEDIPPIGWDYGEVGGTTTTLVYPFAAPLTGGKVTITLAWDRIIDKIGGSANTFDQTNTFIGGALDDLDLFLLPKGWTEPYFDSILNLRSVSSDDNVEHIYADVPPGEYEIVVYQAFGGENDFGLAWWTGNPADFNQDGVVDADDLSEWRSDFGPSPGSDADFDGDSDGNDFLAWQRNLGAGVAATAAGSSVPEPSASLLCCLALPLLRRTKRPRALGAIAVAAGFAVALVGAQGATAASLEFTRNSRFVSDEEAASGAPKGGVVHDFFVTSDADLLCLLPNLDVSIYKHAYGSSMAPPSPELESMFPSVRASSFFSLPGDTFVLGGGFAVPGSVWADLTDDGPQKEFHFGRLTATQAGTFSGSVWVRGASLPVTLPFSFALPDAAHGMLASPSEHLLLLAEEPQTTNPPPAGPVGPDPGDFTGAQFRGSVSIELTRRSRPVTGPERLFKNTPGFVHQFFVTTTTDLISVSDVEIDGKVYQHEEGSSRKPPNARVLKIWPGASADSFLTTPGNTLVTGGGFYAPPSAEISWHDKSDDGPLDEFLFAQLTASETGSFSGAINVRGPHGRVTLPFKFALPGNESDMKLLDGEQTYHLELAFGESPTAQVPEPSAWVLCTLGASLLLRQRIGETGRPTRKA
jgi:hypothetical protein